MTLPPPGVAHVVKKERATPSAQPVEAVGGAKGDRTPDLMTASHALSQLSYGPTEAMSGKYSISAPVSNISRP